jgi:hypothetical protein
VTILESQIELQLRRSTAELLTSGSDSRSDLDAVGLSRHGWSPAPRAGVLPLGSCTASTPSQHAFTAAASAHEELRQAARERPFAAVMEDQWAAVRRELRSALLPSASDDVDIVITPSGTDAELVATLLALGDRRRPLTNVVVAPAEIGSGSALAASFRHFDALVPRGAVSERGAPIDAATAALVRLAPVRVRAGDGMMRPREELDAEVQHVVEGAVAAGHRVLLHVVAHSKTGAHAPSLACVDALTARHSGVAVVVDAAQGRFSRRGLSRAMHAGRLVIVTGSKFYGGVPFYALALGIGQRQGEALGLSWDDIDLDSGTLSVRRALQRVAGQYHFVEPKTSRSRRTVALPPPLVAELRRHRTRQLEERLDRRAPLGRRVGRAGLHDTAGRASLRHSSDPQLSATSGRSWRLADEIPRPSARRGNNIVGARRRCPHHHRDPRSLADIGHARRLRSLSPS